MFRIKRVMNNNVVAVDEDGAEVILTGLGLGFHRKAGDLFDPKLVEQRFVLDDAGSGYVSVLVNLSYELIGLSERVKVMLRETLGVELTTVQQLALADHIHIAVERAQAGLRLDGALVWELKHTYGAEFAAAERILELVFETAQVRLPVEEAAFITTHIVNAELASSATATDFRETNRATAAVREIMGIVRAAIPTLEPGTADYARCLTHVKYTVQRIITGSMLSGRDHLLFEQVRDKEPEAWVCAQVIDAYVGEVFAVQLPQEELFYLLIHIGRLRAAAAHEPPRT